MVFNSTAQHSVTEWGPLACLARLVCMSTAHFLSEPDRTASEISPTTALSGRPSGSTAVVAMPHWHSSALQAIAHRVCVCCVLYTTLQPLACGYGGRRRTTLEVLHKAVCVTSADATELRNPPMSCVGKQVFIN